MSIWAGIDVGGTRKGFHAAAIDRTGLVTAPVALPTVAATVDWALRQEPVLTAIDSPAAPAPPGASARDEELRLRREICGIRWTPSLDALRRNEAYYGWVIHGRAHATGRSESFGTIVVPCSAPPEAVR